MSILLLVIVILTMAVDVVGDRVSVDSASDGVVLVDGVVAGGGQCQRWYQHW